MEKKSSIDRIMKASMAEFAQFGYEGARMDRIAKRARLNKAMIYYHFKSKESLYEKTITDTAGRIYAFVKETSLEEEPLNQIYSLIENCIRYLDAMDLDFVRVMLREVSSGGKYIRKITMPNLLLPVLNTVNDLIAKAKKNGDIIDVNPFFTFFQVLGGILLVNNLRIILHGTDLFRENFKDGYLEEFKDNMLKIVSRGIEKRRGEK
jgi:TetR/AcrR family transcriptional regulator